MRPSHLEGTVEFITSEAHVATLSATCMFACGVLNGPTRARSTLCSTEEFRSHTFVSGSAAHCREEHGRGAAAQTTPTVLLRASDSPSCIVTWIMMSACRTHPRHHKK